MTDLDNWLHALEISDTAARLKAVREIGMVRAVSAAPRLIALLDDPNAEVRVAAANALAQIGLSGEAAQQAIKVLALHQSDPDASVRQAISAALIQLEQAVEVVPASAPELEEVLGESQKIERSRPTGQPAEAASPSESDRFGAASYTGSSPSEDLVDALDGIEIPVLPMSPFSPPADAAPAPPPPSALPLSPALEQEAQEVQFSAYFPREIVPGHWIPLTAYVFKSFAAEQVLADARSTLGAWLAAVRRVISNVRRTLPEGTVITATPYMEGVQFNPPTIAFGFYEDWHRLDFRLRTTDAPLYQAVNGRLTFSVEGVIVADVPLSIYVTDAVGSLPDVASLTSTTSSSSGMQTVSQKLYKSIFCSYSRDDTAIVERVERVYKALGFDFLRDVVSLKSGEDWNDKLYELIEQADIFQLFWSATAAQSEFVEREWRHALSLERDESNFIRPVYWQEPMPFVPSELGDIHFAYEPTLDDNLSTSS